MSNAERELEPTGEHEVTPLELLFDLVFVFAMTQVTSRLADDPNWAGVLRGMLVLAALWWAWAVYAWLTSAMDVDEGGVRLAMLASMGAMFGVALAVPGAFGDDAVLFASRFPRGGRADRRVGGRARDRLLRPGRDRRWARLAGRARALCRAVRVDRLDRARRVAYRHRRRGRVRAGCRE